MTGPAAQHTEQPFQGQGGGGDREGSSEEWVSSKAGSRQTHETAGWIELSDDP